MPDPKATWPSWPEFSVQAVRMAWDAQQVVALRILRMAAGGLQAGVETKQMVTEKAAAASKAQIADAAATLTCGDNRRVTRRVSRVSKRRARNNRRRLTR